MIYQKTTAAICFFIFFGAVSLPCPVLKVCQAPVSHLASPAGVNLSDYHLALQDDFIGSKLNTKTWDYLEENKTRGFGKMLRSNVVVSNGTLKLFAKKTISVTGPPAFSASMISTRQSLNQKYGYFEIRARVNTQIGPHSAFWLLQQTVGTVNKIANPSIYGTEVDIFEYHRAAGTEILYFGLHWNGYNFTDGSHGTVYSSAQIPGISSGFHVFGLEWTPRTYKVFVDGVQRASTDTALSHIAEFIILSTEINGYGGNQLQMTSTPDSFEVDYLKVYARKPEVTIYGDCDGYGWVSESLGPGSYTTAQLAAMNVVNKAASAFEIPQGWTIIAFDEDNFKGDSVVLHNNLRCAAVFNDKLSSLKITAKPPRR